MATDSVKVNMTPGQAALVGLMRRYFDGFLDPFVTLLEVHKLMYFMQCDGEPLRLEFRAARAIRRKPAACPEGDGGAYDIRLCR